MGEDREDDEIDRSHLDGLGDGGGCMEAAEAIQEALSEDEDD